MRSEDEQKEGIKWEKLRKNADLTTVIRIFNLDVLVHSPGSLSVSTESSKIQDVEGSRPVATSNPLTVQTIFLINPYET